MTKKTYMKKRRFLLFKTLEFSKANSIATTESLKKSYKTLDKQQTPNFAYYTSYQEAYDDLYKVLKAFI